MIELSEDQKKVFDTFCEWHKSKKDLFIYSGVAGSGKSFLISYIKEQFPTLRIAFVTYTGKASLVLKEKLKGKTTLEDYIGTIHGLIYSPIIDKKTGKIKGWRQKRFIDYDLIIIDEASMVNEKIFRDLQDYDIPIVAVGDHCQLPPIEGEFNLMENPEFKLETPHRFVANMDLVKVATMARENGRIPFGEYGDNIKKVHYISFMNDEFENYVKSQNFLSGDSIIICAFNKTRIMLNNKIRRILGFGGKTPQINDRVICLKNNQEISPPIFNGSIGTLKRIENSLLHTNLNFAEISLDGYEFPFYGEIDNNCFGEQSPNLYKNKNINVSFFDYGYACTTHKLIGTQFQNVLLFEQDCDLWEHKRWLYTGVTRSTKNLIIVK